MSAQDTERAAALERRYRRLLRCYPPGHRQVHREEMLGVLLAIARPGQRAPGARQMANLVRPSASLTGSAFTLLGVLALAVAVIATRVRGTVGWRVSALVAAPAFLLDAVSIPFAGSLTATAVLSLASLLFTVLVWPVAIASWRGRVRRVSHALPA